MKRFRMRFGERGKTREIVGASVTLAVDVDEDFVASLSEIERALEDALVELLARKKGNPSLVRTHVQIDPYPLENEPTR